MGKKCIKLFHRTEYIYTYIIALTIVLKKWQNQVLAALLASSWGCGRAQGILSKNTGKLSFHELWGVKFSGCCYWSEDWSWLASNQWKPFIVSALLPETKSVKSILGCTSFFFLIWVSWGLILNCCVTLGMVKSALQKKRFHVVKKIMSMVGHRRAWKIEKTFRPLISLFI